jgi:hypothetical protein
MGQASEPLTAHDRDPSVATVGHEPAERTAPNRAGRLTLEPCAREIAAAAGISERHLRRLRKAAAKAAETRQKSATRITTDLLGALGHGDLLGTPAQRYLVDFMTEFVALLSAHIKEDDLGLDERWAKGNAFQTVERLREATRRRRERIEQAFQ